MEDIEMLKNEEFDIQVQKCDPNDCQHDCAPTSSGDCPAWVTGGF